MAPTALVVQSMTRSGLVWTLANSDQANGNQFPISGKEFILVDNGDASPRTITVVDQQTDNRGYTHSIAVAVTNGTRAMIGPFTKSRWADGNGNCQITWSAGTPIATKIAIIANPDGSSDAATL